MGQKVPELWVKHRKGKVGSLSNVLGLVKLDGTSYLAPLHLAPKPP